MNDRNLYQGFAPGKQTKHEAWPFDRHGKGAEAGIARSRAVMKDWRVDDFQDFKAEAIEADLARAMTGGLAPAGAATMAITRRHHVVVARTWKTPLTREASVGVAADVWRPPGLPIPQRGPAQRAAGVHSDGDGVFAEAAL